MGLMMRRKVQEVSTSVILDLLNEEDFKDMSFLDKGDEGLESKIGMKSMWRPLVDEVRAHLPWYLPSMCEGTKKLSLISFISLSNLS